MDRAERDEIWRQEFTEVLHREAHEGIEVITGETNNPCRCGHTYLWRVRILGLDAMMAKMVKEHWDSLDYEAKTAHGNYGCYHHPVYIEESHKHALAAADAMLHDLVMGKKLVDGKESESVSNGEGSERPSRLYDHYQDHHPRSPRGD